METPTISKAQKKSTLSGKKTRVKETIKTTVATPYRSSYWPTVSPEDLEMLKIVLENNLPKIKPSKINVPWKVLKKVPKCDRKKFRNDYTKEDEIGPINKKDREGLVFGVNDVSKLLEKNIASAILISSDVQPRIMVRHIIDQSVLHRVPVIVFDQLRNLLSKVCGITSAVIGISDNITTDSKLYLIKEAIEQVFEKYPAPIDHINYERSLKNISSMEISQQIDDIKIISSKDETESHEELKSNIYLKRESTDKRVFVPEYTEENIKIPRMEVDSTGFLPFSETVHVKENMGTKTSYKSLVVKRLRGDPNRNKRKIQTLKRKLK